MSTELDWFEARDAEQSFQRIAELIDGSAIGRWPSLSDADFDRLIKEIDDLLGKRPESSMLWLWRGYAYYMHEPRLSIGAIGLWEPLARYEEIETAFDRAIDLKPDNCAAVLFLCNFYWHEAQRKGMVRRLPALGYESAEALQAAVETEGTEQTLDRIFDDLYAEFVEGDEPDYSAARQVWIENRQNIDLQWDAIPYWFTYDSEFDGETRLVISDFPGWVGLLREIAVDVFDEADAAWIVSSAVCHADGTSLMEPGERVEHLEWALETGIPEPTYHHLSKLYLLRAKLEGFEEGAKADRNVHFELTDFEDVVAFCEAAGVDEALEYKNIHLIRRDFARFLLDWLDSTPEVQTEPAVTRLVERSQQYVLLGEYGESEGAARLWHFLGQQQMENAEPLRAEQTLRRAFDRLRSEAVGIDLAVVLRDLEREDDAIDLLRSVRAPSHNLRQFLRTFVRTRDELRRVSRQSELNVDRSRSLDGLRADIEATLSKSEVRLPSIQEAARQMADTSARLEQRLDSFAKGADPDQAAEAFAGHVALQLKWIESLVGKLGCDLSIAPGWFRESVISAESIHATLSRRDKADFAPVVFLWGKLAEKALQEGLLIPFGRWLDERNYDRQIPEGKPKMGLRLFPGTSQFQDSSGTWADLFGRYARCDQLLLAAIDDHMHPFGEYIRAYKADVVKGRWLKRELIPARLELLREARNTAAHEGGAGGRSALTPEFAEKIYRLMWKESLLRDLSRLLVSAEAE
jgi:hypothetical protein